MRCKIDGVKPFNNCYFRSCYYHQLISGMSGLGLPPDNILMTAYVAVDKNFVIRTELNDDTLLKDFCGCKLEEKHFTQKRLIRYIAKGDPIIVGVDCFYLQSRADSYKKWHFSHFLLAYGYDLEKGIVNIIDHNYINSHRYEEKTISLSNLLEANRKFKGKNGNNCTVLSRVHKKQRNIWCYIKQQELSDSRTNSAYNLEQIKQLISYDLDGLAQQSGIIADYLKEIKFYLQVLSLTEAVSGRQKLKENVMKLTAAYSFLLSLFWKIMQQENYQYALKVKEQIYSKIDSILALESEFYQGLEEIRQCNSKK